MKYLLTVFARLIKVLLILLILCIVVNPLYEHYHFLATVVELFFLAVVLIFQYLFFGSLNPLYLFRLHKPYELS